MPGFTVTRDEHGVPHIEARDEAELYRGLGWVHGTDRPLQLLLTRMAGRGRLAEHLPGDVDARRRHGVPSHGLPPRARRPGGRAAGRRARPADRVLRRGQPRPAGQAAVGAAAVRAAPHRAVVAGRQRGAGPPRGLRRARAEPGRDGAAPGADGPGRRPSQSAGGVLPARPRRARRRPGASGRPGRAARAARGAVAAVRATPDRVQQLGCGPLAHAQRPRAAVRRPAPRAAAARDLERGRRPVGRPLGGGSHDAGHPRLPRGTHRPAGLDPHVRVHGRDRLVGGAVPRR